jgi:ribosomal protein S1
MSHPDHQGETPQAFIARHAVGDVVDGEVVQHVSFGAFVELGGGVHGLLHHDEVPEAPAPGTALRVEILAMDAERGRVALRPA